MMRAATLRETYFEQVLEKYSDLIEGGLSLRSGQLSFESSRFDLVFVDRTDSTLLVEIKAREILQGDIGQVARYRSHLSRKLGLKARVMIVGTHIKDDIRYAVEDMGFEWKVVTEKDVRARLEAAQDIDLLLGLDGSNAKILEPNIAAPIINEEYKILPSEVRNNNISSTPRADSSRKKTTLDEKYRISFGGTKIGERFSRKQLKDRIVDKFPNSQTRGGILPTDRCYNIVNIGVPNPKIRMFN